MDTERKLIIYIDWVSQPSRALVSFCRHNNIPSEIREIRIFKMEHMSDEYVKINPKMQVPAI